MTLFLEAWKKSQNSKKYVDSCVYPEAFISDEEKKLQKDAMKATGELRTLSMDNDIEHNDDQWFIQNLTVIPRPENGEEYDYMLLDRFVSTDTRRKLKEKQLIKNKYLFEL